MHILASPVIIGPFAMLGFLDTGGTEEGQAIHSLAGELIVYLLNMIRANQRTFSDRTWPANWIPPDSAYE